MDALMVITTLPDAASAEALARQLLRQHLAACVNVLAPCRSIFHWQGELQEAEEVPLLIKTSADRYAELEQAIRAGHPYELPEIVAVALDKALPDYLSWLVRETRPSARLAAKSENLDPPGD